MRPIGSLNKCLCINVVAVGMITCVIITLSHRQMIGYWVDTESYGIINNEIGHTHWVFKGHCYGNILIKLNNHSMSIKSDRLRLYAPYERGIVIYSYVKPVHSVQRLTVILMIGECELIPIPYFSKMLESGTHDRYHKHLRSTLSSVNISEDSINIDWVNNITSKFKNWSDSTTNNLEWVIHILQQFSDFIISSWFVVGAQVIFLKGSNKFNENDVDIDIECDNPCVVNYEQFIKLSIIGFVENKSFRVFNKSVLSCTPGMTDLMLNHDSQFLSSKPNLTMINGINIMSDLDASEYLRNKYVTINITNWNPISQCILYGDLSDIISSLIDVVI